MIDIRHLSKSYGDVQVLLDVDLSLADDRISAFVGKNGAGKTTLMEIIAGIRKPDDGEIWADDALLTIPYAKSIRKRLFYLPTYNIGIMYLNAKENLEYFNALYRKRKDESSLEQLLKTYHLDGIGKMVQEFSLGMKKRMDLAILQLIDPEILLLDEPSIGLDVYNINFLKDRILALKQEGKQVILTSHDMGLLAKVADTVFLFNEGHIETYSGKDVDIEAKLLATYDEDDVK